ncbi:hypothetical protein Tco_0761167 [Tanacetum coccineum]
MDPHTSLECICMGEQQGVSFNDKVESEGCWEGAEFQDTTNSGEKKFIINPKQDDVEPGVVFGRSFLRLTKGIVDFGNRVITIYPDLDSFRDNSDDSDYSGDE